MQAPAFWSTDKPDWRATCLWPLSKLYGAVALSRFNRAPAYRSTVPVVCIGNPTLGGSGKTPMAVLTARCLQALERKPVFLSRGYGAKVAEPVHVDPATHTAAEVGDEPLLLAATAPTVVSPDRAAGAKRAEALGDVIVMDDGFQNPDLHKDLSLLVVDAAAGLGNGRVFPAGPLRLPLGPQLARAGGLVLIGQGARADAVARAAKSRDLSVLAGTLVPDQAIATAIGGRPVIAYAGIGRPEKVFETVEAVGAQIVEKRSFPDHHVYTDHDARGLMALHRRSGAIPVTTEKDLVRLRGSRSSGVRALADASVALPVTLALDQPSATAFQILLERALA